MEFASLVLGFVFEHPFFVFFIFLLSVGFCVGVAAFLWGVVYDEISD